MSTAKETEGRNEEVKVKTVDYRSAAGEEEQGAKKENVEVIHRIDYPKETPGVISQTAAKVAEKIQPAKEAISGSRDHKSN